MNENLAIAIGIFVFIVGLTLALIALGGFLMSWKQEEDERKEMDRRLKASERAVAASVAPHTGLVEVSAVDPPYDRENELEIQKAQAYMWALHTIDAAFDPNWDRALGEGRN